MTKKYKTPDYDDAKRCLSIRIASRKGNYQYVSADMKFCEKILNKYPEWYKATDKDVYYATRPVGCNTTYENFCGKR